MKKFKAAVIGLGRIGFSLEKDILRGGICTHSGGYFNHNGFEFVGGADINKKTLIEFSEYYNFPVNDLYTNYKDLLKNKKIDIISIATWTDTHKQIFLDCVKNKNIKIIFLEKPISLNYKDSKYMINVARKNNKIVVVNYERRWQAEYIKVKQIIENKSLGEVRSVYGNVLTGSFLQAKWHKLIEKRGGPLLHDGVHLIDIILYFFGYPLKIDSKLYKFRKSHKYEHTAFLNFDYKNNLNVFLEIGGRRNYFNFEVDIQFDKGRVKIGNGILEYYEVEKSSRYIGFTDLIKKQFPIYKSKKMFISILDNIYDVLNGKSDKSYSDGNESLKIMKIIKKIYQ